TFKGSVCGNRVNGISLSFFNNSHFYKKSLTPSQVVYFPSRIYLGTCIGGMKMKCLERWIILPFFIFVYFSLTFCCYSVFGSYGCRFLIFPNRISMCLFSFTLISQAVACDFLVLERK